MTFRNVLWVYMIHSLRRFVCLRYRKLLPWTVVLFLLLWQFGVLDHMRETSFEHFKWSQHDVYEETKQLINGKQFTGAVNNWTSVRATHLPRCSSIGADLTYQLLIIVKSSVHNTKARDAIRNTWGKEKSLEDFQIRTIFVLGQFSTAKEQLSMGIAVDRESEQHGDLLVGDMIDSYRNNTMKLLHSLSYAYQPAGSCRTADFVLLIDDDYMLSPHNLIRLLDGKSASEQVYEGWRFDTTPFRVTLHKHRVSLSDYPFDQYPPYISAGAVLLSRMTVVHFYHAIQLIPMYPFDDVYAGIVAHLLQLTPTHNPAFVFWTRDIAHEEWMHGQVIAAHGFDPVKLEEEYPLVRFAVPG